MPQPEENVPCRDGFSRDQYRRTEGMRHPRPWHAVGMDSHDRATDLDLELLDLLREGPRSAYRLGRTLSRKGESVDTEAVRSRLLPRPRYGHTFWRSGRTRRAQGRPVEDNRRRTTSRRVGGRGGECPLQQSGRRRGERRPRRRLLGFDRDRLRDSGVRDVRAAHSYRRFIAVSNLK